MHVKRIFKDGDSESLIWMDVLRSEELVVVERAPYQGINIKLKWDDKDPTIDNNDTGRTTKDLKIYNPIDGTDPDASDAYQTLKVIAKLPTNSSVIGGVRVQGMEYGFKQAQIITELGDPNAPAQIMRVVNRDTSQIDDKLKTGTMTWDDYFAGLGGKDESQWVDQQIPMTIEVKRSATYGVHNQGMGSIYQNKFIAQKLELEEPPEMPGQNTLGQNMLVILDPFQIIINVRWGGLAVQFYAGAG